VQLYRHVLHPRIPRMAFIGHNQSFLFMPSVEISALWMVAVWRNELQLPSLENMEDTMRRVTGWKRKNQAFDPTMFFVTHSRYQQFIDTLLGDIGVNPFRKMPNIFAEMFGKYGSSDYREVFSEYDRHLLAITSTLRPLDVDT
ncbi:FMO1, partial [Symbiodinium microadriaticum]